MSAVTPPDRQTYRCRWALKPKRDARGRTIEGKFVPYWGGRKVSKYCPVAEDAKHTKAGRRARK